MGKADGNKDQSAAPVELEARVDLTEEKISRYLMDDRLREAAGVVAQEIKLVRRIKDGTSVSGAFVEVDGPVYTTVQVRSYTMEALCTCPATGPCPHGGAVALLYLADPETFLDLDRYLRNLDGRSRDELLDMLRQVLSSIPAALEMLDIPDFEGILTAEPPQDDWWDEDDWDDEWPDEAAPDVVDDVNGIFLDDDEEPPDPENLN